MSGCILEEDFKEQCVDLVSVSDKISDGWEVRSDRDDIFLVKKTKISVNCRDLNSDNMTNPKCTSIRNSSTAVTDHGIESLKYRSSSTLNDSDTEDVVSLPDSDPSPTSTSPQQLITFEYHVTYSSSYNVPVLYFNAWHVTGRLLTLEEVWSLVPPTTPQDRYSYITQVDHPLLARPFFKLHPCRTEQLMGLLEGQSRRYLISWLSALGRDVGLTLDMRYAI